MPKRKTGSEKTQPRTEKVIKCEVMKDPFLTAKELRLLQTNMLGEVCLIFSFDCRKTTSCCAQASYQEKEEVEARFFIRNMNTGHQMTGIGWCSVMKVPLKQPLKYHIDNLAVCLLETSLASPCTYCQSDYHPVDNVSIFEFQGLL